MKNNFYSNPNNTVYLLRLEKFLLKEKVIDKKDFDIGLFIKFLIEGVSGYDVSYGKETDSIVGKICKVLKIPKGNCIPFANYFSSNKSKIIKTDTEDDNQNFIIYQNDKGIIRSILNLIRNALAHGNIYKYKGGVLLYSYSENAKEKLRGVLKIDKISDINKIFKYIKKKY